MDRSKTSCDCPKSYWRFSKKVAVKKRRLYNIPHHATITVVCTACGARWTECINDDPEK